MALNQSHNPLGVAILIPVFNDWESVAIVIKDLDGVLSGCGVPVCVLIVDDGSTAVCDKQELTASLSFIERVSVLKLKRNLGHQRAIAVGLNHLSEDGRYQTVIVMDGDGEDDPRDVPRLLEEYDRRGRQYGIFAERTRRSEGVVFASFYSLFRMLHFMLTGRKVRIGNFSVIPLHLVNRLVVVSELWNHYAAAVVYARFPFASIPTKRAKRVAGCSRMNFVNLVVHGLSAMAVYTDIIGVRILVMAMTLTGLMLAGFGLVAVFQVSTYGGIPAWLGYITGLMFVTVTQVITVSLIFVFIVLGRRQGMQFSPKRDCPDFVSSEDQMLP